MVTDYEAAWIALGEFVSSKTQHGREGLLTKMAELASDHRVPAGELSRLLRLHGVEVERARSVSAETRRDEGPASAEDDVLDGTGSPRPSSTDGGHDGSRKELPGTPATVEPASPRSRADEPTPADAARAEAEEQRQANAVEAYARAHEGLTEENERDALDFLLAPKPPRLYDVKTTYDTEDGPRKLTFVVRGVDGRKLDSIEQAHVSETTGRLDRISADCQLVAESTTFLEGRLGHQVELTSQQFLTVKVPNPDNPSGFEEQQLASPADALEARFRTQLGLVSGVAAEIRRVSGYDPERVGSAKRRLVNAVGNS